MSWLPPPHAVCLAVLFACEHGLTAPYVAYVGNVPVHSASANAKILVYDLATGTTINVTDGLQAARSPAWSPDGSRLAFEAIERGLTDIFVCAPDGSDRVNVTQTPDAWETSPALLDANRVVFLEGPDRTDLWLLEITSGLKTRLTSASRFHGRPVVSSDGELIALTAADKLAGPGDILLIEVATGAIRRLTKAIALYSNPAFSPNGQDIAFCFDGCEIGGATRGVAILNISDGELRLLSDDGYPSGALSFAPDGKRIAYTSANVYHTTWVNLVNADGSGDERLNVGSAHVIGWPSFSPDGRRLAFQAVYAARYTVRVVDLLTGEVRTITPDGETGVNPTFSPR